MVIVGGTFEVDPAEREEFLTGRLEAMRSSRAEPGCLEYTFSADPLDPGRVLLFEKWETEDALNTHLAGIRSRPQAGGTGVTPKKASIVIYEVAAERPLGP